MSMWSLTSCQINLSPLQKHFTSVETHKKNKTGIPTSKFEEYWALTVCISKRYHNVVICAPSLQKRFKCVGLLSTKRSECTADEGTNKPHFIMDYNMRKQGVDAVNQMCNTYSVACVTKRWTMAVWLTELDIAGISTQILFHSNAGNTRKHMRIYLKQ
ncbi:uncharacterized protein LOC126335772 [Schistocerca gregaria]|uniref:uncharacterized protein LOC126335772 n=1 Tax=Schistocerca gregaria TaxID=7010 RepID=UPI00211DFB87|nr:uncharacterized protein LOC126335772 [Schistocerca gregaria]